MIQRITRELDISQVVVETVDAVFIEDADQPRDQLA
jgi:hypothetical protein